MGELLTRDGTHIVYEKHGKGKPLIMLHALNMNLATFNSTVQLLKYQYTIYTMDSRDMVNQINNKKFLSKII